jgi:hypothetical protein
MKWNMETRSATHYEVLKWIIIVHQFIPLHYTIPHATAASYKYLFLLHNLFTLPDAMYVFH